MTVSNFEANLRYFEGITGSDGNNIVDGTFNPHCKIVNETDDSLGIWMHPLRFNMNTGARSTNSSDVLGTRLLEIIMLDDHYHHHEVELINEGIIQERDADYYGSAQKAWLENVLMNSTATYRMICQGSPVVKYPVGGDNIWNQMPKDYAWLKDTLQKYNCVNTIFVGGDSHIIYSTRDTRHGNIPINNLTISGAHKSGRDFIEFRSKDNCEFPFVFREGYDTSVFATIEPISLSMFPRFQMTPYAKDKLTGLYNSYIPYNVHEKMMQPLLPHGDSLSEVKLFVNELDIIIDVSGINRVGINKQQAINAAPADIGVITLKGNEKLVGTLYSANLNENGKYEIDGTKYTMGVELGKRELLIFGNTFTVVGKGWENKLSYGQPYILTLSIVISDDSKDFIFVDTIASKADYGNIHLRTLSFFNIVFTSATVTNDANFPDVNPSGFGDTDLQAIVPGQSLFQSSITEMVNLQGTPTGNTLNGLKYSSSVNSYVTGQLIRSYYSNPPPDSVSTVTGLTPEGPTVIINGTSSTFNSIVYGVNVMPDAPFSTKYAGNLPYHMDVYDEVTVEFYANLSYGGTFPYNSFYFFSSHNLSKHGQAVSDGTPPPLMRWVKREGDTGYIDSGMFLRTNFSGLPWSSNITEPAGLTKFNTLFDFKNREFVLFFDGKYAGSTKMHPDFYQLAAMMNNPNGSCDLGGFKIYTKGKPYAVYGTDSNSGETGWYYPMYLTIAAAGNDAHQHVFNETVTNISWYMPNNDKNHAVTNEDSVPIEYTKVLAGGENFFNDAEGNPVV